MYLIDSGRVRVFKTIEVGGKIREVELCDLGPMSMFGEMAMIDESRRSATVQAVEQTQCTVITKKIFEDQLTRIPPWMVNLIRILVSRLRETNEKLRKMVEEYTPNPMDVGVITIQEEDARCIRMDSSIDTPEDEYPSDASPEDRPERHDSRDVLHSLFRTDQ